MLEERCGLITGAATGIGRATARLMADYGASVVVADVDDEGGEETCGLIREAGGKAEFVHCDVSVADQVRELVDSAVEYFGRLDFAANNAGIEGPSVPIQDYPEDGYDRVMAVNLKGVYLCVKEQARKMIDQGHGSIVNTASIAGFIGFPPFSGYVATKHGVMGLTRTAALELAPQGIRVNAVCPGYVLTEMGARSIAAPGTPEFAELTKGLPLGRLGKPEEIGEAICWLCSDRSSLVTGHGLLADGGYVAG